MSEASVGLVWFTPSKEDFEARKLSSAHYLGLGYLAAYLEQQGVSTKQYVLSSVTPEQFADEVVADGVRVLGFSIKDTNYYAARWAALAVKAVRPSIVTAAGGLTATFSDELVLRESAGAIDVCFRGYSEHNFADLVASVLSGRDWHSGPGISFMNGAGPIRNQNGAPEESGNLDRYPSPYLSGALPGTAGIEVGVSTSRGCTFHCTFCNPTAMARSRVAFHTVDRVVSEIRHIDRSVGASGAKGRGMMLLSEDYFAIAKKRTRRLCDEIAKSPPEHLVLGCETRLDGLDEELLTSMYAAGVRFLKFGLESGNPRILNTIKKVRSEDGAQDNYEAERRFLRNAAEVVKLARSIGFWVVAGAVFGLPGERLADAIDTLDVLCNLEVDEYYHNYLHLFPGTEIFRTHKTWGYRLEVREDFYPTIYRTYWPYPVELVPRLDEKLKRGMPRGVLQL